MQQTQLSGQSSQEQMRGFMSLKYSKPHHSQLHANQYELLCIDDDPVFQVVNISNLSPKVIYNIFLVLFLGCSKRIVGIPGFQSRSCTQRRWGPWAHADEKSPARPYFIGCWNANGIWARGLALFLTLFQTTHWIMFPGLPENQETISGGAAHNHAEWQWWRSKYSQGIASMYDIVIWLCGSVSWF